MQYLTLEEYQRALKQAIQPKIDDSTLIDESTEVSSADVSESIEPPPGSYINASEHSEEINVLKPVDKARVVDINDPIPTAKPAVINYNYQYTNNNRRTQPVSINGRTFVSEKSAHWSLYRKLNFPSYKQHFTQKGVKVDQYSFMKYAAKQWNKLTPDQKKEAVACPGTHFSLADENPIGSS